MVNLPEEYTTAMKKLLGEEYGAYLESFKEKSQIGIRINTLKVSVEEWNEISPFHSEPVAWTEKGFILDREQFEEGILHSKHPYYYAGLYYIQEPSAMIPASILPVEPGDKVLDLCAAPGGKATELAAKLNGTGILVANDISVSRAMALAKNLQMMGVRNAVVTAETSTSLRESLPQYFDKILIDAPCSGEGMFRREPRMIKDWQEQGPEYYAKIQKEILQDAYQMLIPGGKMVYSTCTFSVVEDEQVIQWFLKQYPDMKISPVEFYPGFSHGRPDLVEDGDESLRNCIRIFPHKAKGEGHFAVLLEKEVVESSKHRQIENENLMDELCVTREELSEIEINSLHNQEKSERKQKSSKSGQEDRERNSKSSKSGQEDRERKKKGSKERKRGKGFVSKENTVDTWKTEMEQILPVELLDSGVINQSKKQISLSSEQMLQLKSLRILQNGLILGEAEKRFEPSTQLALALKEEEYTQRLNLSLDDIRVLKYLKGETIMEETSRKGWILVCVDGYPLGWCKANGQGMLKNKYYAGWRMQ